MSAIQFFEVLLLLQYMTHFNFSNIHIIMIISIILQHFAIHNGSHILQLILPTILSIVIHIVSNSLIHSILDCSIVELRFVLFARVLIWKELMAVHCLHPIIFAEVVGRICHIWTQKKDCSLPRKAIVIITWTEHVFWRRCQHSLLKLSVLRIFHSTPSRRIISKMQLVFFCDTVTVIIIILKQLGILLFYLQLMKT